MRTIISVLVSITISIQAFSQDSLSDRIKWWNVAPGTIIKDGNRISGYIRLDKTISFNVSESLYPWQFQGDIKFIEKNVFETSPKIKLKLFEKFGPSDIEGYTYNNDSLVFESVTYADNSAVGFGMIAKKMFLRVMERGKIDLFLHFSGFDEENPTIIRGFHVYRKGKESKLRLVDRMDVQAELSECEPVVRKFQNKEYDGDREQIRLRAIRDYNICK